MSLNEVQNCVVHLVFIREFQNPHLDTSQRVNIVWYACECADGVSLLFRSTVQMGRRCIMIHCGFYKRLSQTLKNDAIFIKKNSLTIADL
jgi:hypothetical protein